MIRTCVESDSANEVIVVGLSPYLTLEESSLRRIVHALTGLVTGLVVALHPCLAHSDAPLSEAEVSPEKYVSPYTKAKESIVFIYRKGSEPCTNAKDTLGTGFFMHLTLEDDPSTPRTQLLLITNRHVVAGHDEVVLRLNGVNGNAVCQPFPLKSSPPDQNFFQPDRADVDLVALQVKAPTDTNPASIGHDCLLDIERIKLVGVTEGSEVFTAGYFLGYAGFQKNLPLIRSGKVAMLSDEYWLTSDAMPIPQQAYMCELGITHGASGSPVFIAPEQIRVRPGATSPDSRNVGTRVLGVVKGFPPLSIPIEFSIPVTDAVGGIAVSRVMTVYTKTEAPGLATVEPAQNLKELLEIVARELTKRGHKIRGYGPLAPVSVH